MLRRLISAVIAAIFLFGIVGRAGAQTTGDGYDANDMTISIGEATSLLDGPLNLGDVDPLSGALLGDLGMGGADNMAAAVALADASALAFDAKRLADQARQATSAKRANMTGGTVGDEIPYAATFNEAAAAVGMDARLLAAVAWQESVHFDPDVISCAYDSPAGAKGIMQFMPGTAAGYGIDPCDPYQAIPASAKMYKGLYDQFGSWDLAMAGYNAGPGAVEQYGGVPPYAETRSYIAGINAKWAEYREKWPNGQITNAVGRETTDSTGQCTQQAAGITVACEIAGNVAAAVADAGADGVTLTGSGWRDTSEQIELRREHCGTSDYAIYEMPSGDCSPPTAIPGRSMHERGLAIDFENCSSHSTACWQWLNSYGADYGLYNLPSEPWHWSTTGS